MSPAVDSVGAQLLQGLSIHSSSAAAPSGQYQDNMNMYNQYDHHRTMGRSSMSNSTYTAAVSTCFMLNEMSSVVTAFVDF